MPDSEQPVIPVRRLHNYLYCPRLMYFQFVEGVFVQNQDVVDGDRVHRRVDTPVVARFPDDIEDTARETIRSLAMDDPELGITGVADLLRRQEDGSWKLYDYKHGSPMTDENGKPVSRDSDALQVVAYAYLARKQGLAVTSGAIYYAKTKQMLDVFLPEDDFMSFKKLVTEVRACAAGPMPDPLKDDVRCQYCSLYPVCLPDETLAWKRQKKSSTCTRPPVTEEDDGMRLVVSSPKAYVSKRGDAIVVTDDGKEVASCPVHATSSIAIYGTAQLSTQVMQMCMKEGIAVSFFSPAGAYIGRLDTLSIAGLDSRHGQYSIAESMPRSLKISALMIKAKIANQRTLLLRNSREKDRRVLEEMAELAKSAVRATSKEELMGIEGRAANMYFGQFSHMLVNPDFAGLFNGRSRRPPKDPVNSMLSMGYSVLASELAGICHAVGLDPACGILHVPGYGRPALALDLMEEFRPLIVDSVVLSLVNRGAVDMSDFLFASTGCALRKSGHQAFWSAYARRMNEELTHPTFKYRMSYRRLLEVQARQLWRIFRGDISSYHPIITR